MPVRRAVVAAASAATIALPLLSPTAAADSRSSEVSGIASDPARSGAAARTGDDCKEGAGRQSMVAAAHPAAALAGCRVLLAGGSAIDAAVAVQAVLTVVEPQSSGLGGGSLLTYYDADSRKTHLFDGLAASGKRVTAGLSVPTEDERRRHGIDAFDSSVDYSARAVGVPGTPAVLDQVHSRYGKLGWNRLFEDAVSLSAKGFPVARYLHDTLSSSNAATPGCAYPDLRKVFCDGDTPKPVGATVRNPELADVLREVRDGGAAAFYSPRGRIAPAIVNRLHAGAFDPTADERGPAVIPSQLTLGDFTDYRPAERKPLCTKTLAHTLCTAPPPASGGLTLTNLLRIAEAKGITKYAPNSDDYAHFAIEASRVAGVDSRAHVGDPDYDDVPLEKLTDPAYVAERAAEIKPDTALHPVTPGSTDPGSSDHTSQISIVDAQGNALSMTTTVNQNFGSRVMARGMVLNNVATNFSSAGARVNAMEPGKRPRTSIAPSIVFDNDGRVDLVVGAAGGGPIPDYIAQTVLGVISYGEDPAKAISRPHVSGQARVANCAGVPDVASDVEAGTSAESLLPALKQRRHPCARATTLRSGLAAVGVTEEGTLHGAADPRRDGVAFGQ
ncbi:gamma-glutamyltransferase family protein [Streptomyces boluensis]|uniref:Gamma-glutamyltransferase family protein n=1 Tax=Streptomyces boluensis TaxID=1775135 RepID=A0A964ULN9_9ACTN|nr:gamma-glutamyltransferase family protein [Streptomyces boluensis]NBE50937.1 gamma-glutamyltransferase family protein [Streptomyces boluensis]